MSPSNEDRWMIRGFIIGLILVALLLVLGFLWDHPSLL